MNGCRDHVIVSHKLRRSEMSFIHVGKPPIFILVNVCCCHGNRRETNSHEVGQVAKERAVCFILPFLHHP